jgi:hypothetical protein
MDLEVDGEVLRLFNMKLSEARITASEKLVKQFYLILSL